MPWRRKWQPTSVILPGKPHGQRSLVGYSPWGCKELDTTDHAHSKLNTSGFQSFYLTSSFCSRISFKTQGYVYSACLLGLWRLLRPLFLRTLPASWRPWKSLLLSCSRIRRRQDPVVVLTARPALCTETGSTAGSQPSAQSQLWSLKSGY